MSFTRIRVFSKTEIFLRLDLSSIGKRRFRPQIQRFLKTLFTLWIFKNGDLSYSCGRSKPKVFEYDDVKLGSSDYAYHRAHALVTCACSICEVWRIRIVFAYVVRVDIVTNYGVDEQLQF